MIQMTILNAAIAFLQICLSWIQLICDWLKKMSEGMMQWQAYLRHQAMVMIHVTPTPRYLEMGVIKILRTTGEYNYIIVRDVGNAGRMREVMEDGKVDLRGMNLLHRFQIEMSRKEDTKKLKTTIWFFFLG